MCIGLLSDLTWIFTECVLQHTQKRQKGGVIKNNRAQRNINAHEKDDTKSEALTVRTSTKVPRGDIRCSGRVSMSCSVDGTCHTASEEIPGKSQ